MTTIQMFWAWIFLHLNALQDALGASPFPSRSLNAPQPKSLRDAPASLES